MDADCDNGTDGETFGSQTRQRSQVVLERENETRRVIGDAEEVRLGRPGLERFAARSPAEVTIDVHGYDEKFAVAGAPVRRSKLRPSPRA